MTSGYSFRSAFGALAAGWFARFGAPPTPVQLDRVEPIAQRMFPLDGRVEKTPWLGARPCLPDMLPAISPIPGRRGLWANFGHHHLGFTLGPISARLLAEMITGEKPFTDPKPYPLSAFEGFHVIGLRA